MANLNEQILENFSGGINCAQQVAGFWAEKLGYNKRDVMRMAAGFGGGCGRGDLCGVVSGALMVIGLKYGHSEPGDLEGKALTARKAKEFNDKFIKRNGSVTCRDLLQIDFSKEGEKQRAIDTGLIVEVCPQLIQDAIEILDEIMQ